VIIIGLVVLYFAAKLVTYAVLSARSLFEEQQKKKHDERRGE
jgi:hypothetical protein